MLPSTQSEQFIRHHIRQQDLSWLQCDLR